MLVQKMRDMYGDANVKVRQNCCSSGHKLAITIMSVVMSGFVAGCADDPEGFESVSGQITFKGQPLEQGMIQFIPLAAGQPTFSGAVIDDGAYIVPADGGLAAGSYEVRISSGAAGTAAADPLPGVPGTPLKERIPPDYNSKTKQRVEVSPSGENRFDFHIP